MEEESDGQTHTSVLLLGVTLSCGCAILLSTVNEFSLNPKLMYQLSVSHSFLSGFSSFSDILTAMKANIYSTQIIE